eukprot:Opistho-1_new@56406
MKVKEILALLPDEYIQELASTTHVDYYAKKLKGKIIFKLLLLSVLTYKDNSLRRMESVFESMSDEDKSDSSISISSISERLSTINVDFFKKLYEKSVELYGAVLPKEKVPIIKYDSTIVSLSSKLLQTGYNLKGGDAQHIRQLKFTIGHSTIPLIADLYVAQKYTSENVALRETIEKHRLSDESIRVFDRGISARKTYDSLIEKGTLFVTRINPLSKHEIIKTFPLEQQHQTSTLIIHSDELVYLFADKGKKSKFPVRCIKAIQKQSQEPLFFITNKIDLTAVEISQIYKSRWKIETFFKFIKQELNFSHLINRSANGIEIMLYITLIASILLIVYKQTNQIKGYKIMKQKFLEELKWDTITEIIIYCGGDPNKIEEIKPKNKT